MNLYYRNMNFGIPASKAWVEKLEVLPGSSFDPKPDCLICQETYANEDSILKLTCNHMFHKDCVRSWLDKHNTCPVCRAEFPTDDLEYENRKRQQQSNDPLADFITGNNNSNNNNRNNGGNNNGNNNGGQPSFSSSYHS